MSGETAGFVGCVRENYDRGRGPIIFIYEQCQEPLPQTTMPLNRLLR
jgi:hypothetical protein